MKAWRTLFPNALFVAIREYLIRIRGRSFIWGTILLVAIGFVAAQGPVIIEFVAGQVKTKVEVYAKAPDLPAGFLNILDVALNGDAAVPGSKSIRAFDVQAAPASLDAAIADLEKGKYGALLVVDRDPATHDLAFELRSDTPSDGRQATMLRSAANSLAGSDRLARAGVSVASLQAPVKFSQVGAKGGTATTEGGVNAGVEDSTKLASRYLLLTALIVLIFMAIITYGTWVATSVAEEKSSRVMELMLNATTPLQMLAGKVLGNGFAGLTQYGAVLAAAVVGLIVQGPIRERVLGTGGSSPFEGLNAGIFAAFVVLFVLGFLLYALLYAALGSLVSRQEDVQSATAPLMVLIMIGYFVSVFSLQPDSIDSPFVIVLSYIPFFSPYVMLARVGVGHVALWEFGLVVGLMFLAIAAAVFIAARIYSAGVLLYGQKVGLRQIFSAARVSR